MALATSEERDQINALKAHQKAVRGHKSAKKRVDALAEALADAQTDHAVAGTERDRQGRLCPHAWQTCSPQPKERTCRCFCWSSRESCWCSTLDGSRGLLVGGILLAVGVVGFIRGLALGGSSSLGISKEVKGPGTPRFPRR